MKAVRSSNPSSSTFESKAISGDELCSIFPSIIVGKNGNLYFDNFVGHVRFLHQIFAFLLHFAATWPEPSFKVEKRHVLVRAVRRSFSRNQRAKSCEGFHYGRLPVMLRCHRYITTKWYRRGRINRLSGFLSRHRDVRSLFFS